MIHEAGGKQDMAQGKVEICGVNTAKLPLLKADEKEKLFIEEITRVTYERDKAIRLCLPLSDVRPAFAS